MVLPDYYKILQVPTTASSVEIKAAYRRLAKIYHPDKSSGYADEEKFKQIKEAYENLINPQKRARYDARRNRAISFSSPSSSQEKKQTKKNYNFTEEEAKRRQYYQQHYKKAQASTSKSKAPAPPQPQQNELKYILISVPVAVALLLLIIRIYEKPSNEKINLVKKDTTTLVRSDINTPESPYKSAFGKVSSDTNSRGVIKLINRSGYDAVVFLANDSGKVKRHHFIADNYELFAEDLLPDAYRVYYWLGNGFSYRSFLFDTLMGNFYETQSIDSSKETINLSASKNDTFTFYLQNNKKKDTLLLKRIFSKR